MNFIKSIWLVFWVFKSPRKTYYWFTTPNPMLGNIKPMTMVYIGRSHKLLKLIRNMLDGNIA